MNPKDLVVGKKYKDVDFPEEYLIYNGQIPEGSMYAGEYEFHSFSITEGTNTLGVILTQEEVERDVTPF